MMNSYRRRILTQLNRGESRHSVARAVFHGQRGELRQRYREGQEDQLGALGLVVNAIVLWNTFYMEAALQQVRAEGVTVVHQTMWHGSRPWCTNISTFRGATRLRYPRQSRVANCVRCGIPTNPSEDEEW